MVSAFRVEAARGVRGDFPVIYASGNPVNPKRSVGGSVFLSKPCCGTEVVKTACELARKTKNGSRHSRKSPAGRSRALQSPSEASLSETEISQGDGCQSLASADAVAGEGEHLFAQRELQALLIAPILIGS